MNEQDRDDYVNFVALPVEEQRGLTQEEQLAQIDEAFDSNKKEQDYFTTHPLTTDVIGRGYPISDKELESIRVINEIERELLNEDASLKPNDEGYSYYIIEDGRIFKTNDDVICYGLDFTDMTWNEDPTYMSIMYDSFVRYSKLYNFRDYYAIKKKDMMI